MPKSDYIFEQTILQGERLSRLEEKIDRLIATETARQTAANPPQTPDVSANATDSSLPDNASQLTGFVINKMGKLGLPILILSILVGGYLGMQEVFSTINQRDESVRKTFTETAVATLKVGKDVVENTEKLIQLNSSLGEAGQNLLTLQQKAAEEAAKATEARQEADGLKKRLGDKESLLVAAQQKVDTKDGQLSVLRDNLTAKEKKLKQATDELTKEQAALAKEQAEIELARKNLAEREKLLRDKDAKISKLQAETVATKADLKRSREKATEEQVRYRKELADLRARLETLRASVGTTPEPVKPSSIDVIADNLRQFAMDPGTIDADKLRALEEEVVTKAEVDALMRTDLGFETVYMIDYLEEFGDLKDRYFNYFLVRKSTLDQYTGVAFVGIAESDTFAEVDKARTITFVRLRDLTDYSRVEVAAIAESVNYSGSIEAETILKFSSDRDTAGLIDLLDRLFSEIYGYMTVRREIIFGEGEKEVNVLSLADASAKYPELIERWSSDDGSVAVAMEMVAQAKNFEARKLVPETLFEAEPSLRSSLVRLMNASVNGETAAVEPLLAKPLTTTDLGRLAAISLRGKLEFNKQPDIQIAQSKATEQSQADIVQAASATIFAVINQPLLDRTLEKVEFRFRRESGNPEWQLIGFGATSNTEQY